MNDFEPTITYRTVVLSIAVSTDEELAEIHAALSRAAAGYICDGLDSIVSVMPEDDEDDEHAAVGTGPHSEAGE